MDYNQKKLLLEKFGQILISEVRDPALHVAMMVAKFTTPNQIDKENYAVLSTLSEQQQEKVCDLLSLTITDTIYRILEMIEENDDFMELILNDQSQTYNLTELSEKVSAEIVDYENGWIQRFSEIGRFVL